MITFFWKFIIAIHIVYNMNSYIWTLLITIGCILNNIFNANAFYADYIWTLPICALFLNIINENRKFKLK